MDCGPKSTGCESDRQLRSSPRSSCSPGYLPTQIGLSFPGLQRLPLQTLNQRRVSMGDVAEQRHAAGCCGERSIGFDIVFDQDRITIEKPSSPPLPVDRTGVIERRRIESDHSVDLRIDLLHTLRCRLGRPLRTLTDFLARSGSRRNKNSQS